jgi:hypothetical protein
MEWFDNKQNLLSGRLQKLKIDIREINLENLGTVTLTIDQICTGLVKSYFGEIEDTSGIFSNVLIQEYIDSSKIVCLIRSNITEPKVKEIVNLFHSVLGLDKVFRADMNAFDINRVRKDGMDYTLREWVFDDFILKLKADLTDDLLLLWILNLNKKCNPAFVIDFLRGVKNTQNK